MNNIENMSTQQFTKSSNDKEQKQQQKINVEKSSGHRVTKCVKNMTLNELRKSKGFRRLGDMLYMD